MPFLKCLLFWCLFPCVFFAGVFLGPAQAASLGLLKVDELVALERESYRLVDARPLEKWQAGHLPGAMPLYWEDLTATDAEGVAYRRRPTDQLAERLGQLGIDEKTTLVVYGDADSSWGGEGWLCWLLSELGHAGNISLLEGGVQAWQKTYPLVLDELRPSSPAVYHVASHPELDISTAELLLIKDRVQLIDTRSFFEWLRGAIPGAVRINWTEFFTGRERIPISKHELMKLFEKNGIDPQKPVVYYCSGGIRSAYAWTVHQLAGLPTARNYDGGMAAWQKRP